LTVVSFHKDLPPRQLGQICHLANSEAGSMKSIWEKPRTTRNSPVTQDNQICHQCHSYRSYAEVVHSCWSKYYDQSKLPLCSPIPSLSSSSSVGRQRRVLFISSPKIATFRKGFPPVDIHILDQPKQSDPTKWMHRPIKILRSCLKQSRESIIPE
jgi:hypothetical protein